MQDDQKAIYFITGESKEYVEKAPFLEKLNKKGYEVIYMTDAIDEYMMQQLRDFDGKSFVNISKSNLNIEENKEDYKEYDEFCKTIKEILNNKIEKAIVSNRLVSSPCCLVTSEYGWSANMERIMKAQALGNTAQGMMGAGKRILEINPTHSIIESLADTSKHSFEDDTVRNLIWLLYDTSVLSSGFTLDEPTNLSNRIQNLIKLGLSIGVPENDDKESLEDDIKGPVDGCPNVSNEHHSCSSFCKEKWGKEDEEESETTMEEVD